jgi:hypothetical protein
MAKRITRKLAAEAAPSLRRAGEHLLRAWDELRESEEVTRLEITTGELGQLVVDVEDPADASRLSAEQIFEWLKNVRDTPK